MSSCIYVRALGYGGILLIASGAHTWLGLAAAQIVGGLMLIWASWVEAVIAEERKEEEKANAKR